MQDDHAQAIADLIVVGLGAVAAVYIFRTPPLRRAVWRALKYGVVTAAPRLLWQETTRAWSMSGNREWNRNPNLESRIKNPESRIMIE
jgi:hypothetical protein